MADDKSKQDYRDDSKIADDELYYWSNKWSVSKETILQAIEQTGSHAVSTIEEFLKDSGLMQPKIDE